MKSKQTKDIVTIALFTAIVIVLQALAISIRFGVFTITLVLIPIVVGAALCGSKAGAWLGFVFGVVVLLTDAGAFLAISVPGTIVTCIGKGALAGLCAGLVYRAIENKNKYLAVMASAVVAPIVNTGVFLLGCRLFFFETISTWAIASGFANATAYMFLGLVGANFLVEMGVNLLLSPVILRLINLGKK